MKLFTSFIHVVFLCSFSCVSLCLLSLSWAEDVAAPSRQADEDNFTSANFSEDLIVSVNSVVTNSALVQSSFDELPTNSAGPFDEPEFAFVDTASQNSGVFNEITDTGQGVVFTLADAATAELQQRADIPSAITSHNETPNWGVSNETMDEQSFVAADLKAAVQSEVESGSDETNRTQQRTDTLDVVEEEMPTIEAKENATEKQEEIPSFSEWAQKQLEEAEKKKELVNTSSQTVNVNGKSNSNVKLRSKNYASLDCGAKIAAANPEAVSANAVLSPSRDEYKLNACTNRIWFIVELCEAVQAKKIDLANFELFSSSPKDFTVSVSDRFPSRDWMNVGQFTAKDERDVQSFDLHPHLFGKFIKVEMHSHHGSEHFCPISLFRVYGTSEFEVLEKEDEAHNSAADDEDDDEALSSNGDPPKNLFSSATDAVISIVKKAAQVLGNKANNSNQTGAQDRSGNLKSTSLKIMCGSPSHLIVCDNCSDVLFGEVYNVMSCRTSQVYNLIKTKLIKKTLYGTDACKEFGLDFRRKRNSRSRLDSAYVKSFFSPTYLAALCNGIAVIENKVVLNISSKQFPNVTKEIPCDEEAITSTQQLQSDEVKPTEQLILDKIELATSIPDDATNITDKSEIKPTRAFTPENDLNTHVSPESKDDVKTAAPPSDVLNHQENNVTTREVVDMDLDLTSDNLTDYEVTTESSESLDIDLMSELNNFGSSNYPNTASISNTIPQAKESVFLRLSNRIKALERNMSLSSQYLEELSRRYKKQVEEMQRLLDKTLTSLNDESKKRDEHNRRLEQQLSELSAVVNALMIEKSTWITTTYWLLLTMFSIFGILTFCRRAEHKHATSPDVAVQTVTLHRRKSIAVVNHNTPQKKQRRPSEEALKITGTYKDLMIDELDNRKKFKERKKRKKKHSLPRSLSISMLAEEEGAAESDATTRTTVSDVTSKPSDWEVNSISKSRIEDIPFVLEESDNSPLQSLPTPQTLDSLPPDKVNGNIHLQTANDSRSKRNGSVKISTYESAPPPPSPDTNSLDEVKPVTPKKKGAALKRILKKVF